MNSHKGVVTALILFSLGLAACASGATTATRPAATKVPPTATARPTARPTAQVSHYPPHTKADLVWLAARGTASGVHEVNHDSVGTAQCLQPKRWVTVDPSVTGQP